MKTTGISLDDVAFGSDPGRWPLPAATTPTEHWLRAVAAGGQGRYAAAVADLDAVPRGARDDSLVSLAHSTRASFLRQLGGHAAARTWDGRAWACSGADVPAGTDALIGLAADALGVGRFAASDRFLCRAADRLGNDATGRLPVRLAWVRAELAMAVGEGAEALRHAEHAVDVADRLASTRHIVKSQVVLAAASCCAGDVESARRVADAALGASERFGLIPLSWALSCLLTDVGSGICSPSQIGAMRTGHEEAIRSRGGSWTAR